MYLVLARRFFPGSENITRLIIDHNGLESVVQLKIEQCKGLREMPTERSRSFMSDKIMVEALKIIMVMPCCKKAPNLAKRTSN